MGGRLNMFVFISLVVAAMLHGSSAQTTHVVGDGLGWLVPPGGDAAYRTWAASKTFTVGDILVFNFTANAHDVAEVSKEAFDSCNATNPISLSTTTPTNITLTSAGEHHFICTIGAGSATSHCSLGQRLAINVSAASGSPAPQPATPPPSPSPAAAPSPAVPAPGPSRAPVTYIVGDALGWVVPPGGPIAYQVWARNKTFLVGDILVFNFTNGQHNVLQVTRAEFDSCNVTTTTTPPTTTTPARITLTSAGEHYYISTISRECILGQKLAINVTGGSSAAPAPAPSSPAPTAQTPSSSPNPPPTSGDASPPPPSNSGPITPPPPPSPSSAPSVAVAALPFTFLAVALAFLYN